MKGTKWILSGLFILIYQIGFCQDSKLDSLHSLLPTVKVDSARIKILMKIAQLSTPEVGTDFAQRAYAIATQNLDTVMLAKAEMIIGNIESKKGNIQTSLTHAKNAARLYREMDMRLDESKQFTNIGIRFFRQNQLDSAEFYYRKAIDVQEKVGYKKGVANCWSNIGVVNRKRKDYKKAIIYFDKSLEIRNEITDYTGIGSSYNNIAIVHAIQKDYYPAIEYFLLAKEAYHKGSKLDRAYNALRNTGFVFMEIRIYKKALLYLKEAEGLAIKEADDELKFDINNVLGALYKRTEDYGKAIEYFKKAKGFLSEEDKVSEVGLLGNLASLYIELKDYSTAKEYNDKQVALAEKHGLPEEKAIAYISQATILFYNKKYKDAIRAIEKAEDLLKPNHNLEAWKELHFIKAQSLKKLGKTSSAYDALFESTIVADSIYEKNLNEELLAVEGRYQSQIKKDSIELLKMNADLDQTTIQQKNTESQRRGWMIVALLSLIGGLGFIIYSIRKKNRQIREEKEKTEILLNAYESIREKSITLGIREIPLDEILYARVRNKITTLFFEKVNEQGEIEHSYYSFEITLQQLLAQLKLKSFLDFARINQNYIINFQKVDIQKEGKEFVIERLVIDKEKFSDVHDDNISTLPRSEIGRFFQKERERFLKIQRSKD